MKPILSFRLRHAAGIALLLGAPAVAAEVHVELNKLEAQDQACRAYLVLENRSDTDFTEFRFDLVMFDPQGVINKRLAVEAAPLRSAKTTVKLFDIDGVECADIGRILINDIIACRDAEGEQVDCIALVRPSARGDVPFVK